MILQRTSCCVFKNIQNNPSQTTTFIFTTSHEAEPPQRFCNSLAQNSSIVFCREKRNLKNFGEGTEVTSYSIKVFRKFHGPQSVHICTFPMAFQTGTQSLPNFLMKITKIKRIFLPSDLSHPGMQKSRTTEFFRFGAQYFQHNHCTFSHYIQNVYLFTHTDLKQPHNGGVRWSLQNYGSSL